MNVTREKVVVNIGKSSPYSLFKLLKSFIPVVDLADIVAYCSRVFISYSI